MLDMQSWLHYWCFSVHSINCIMKDLNLNYYISEKHGKILFSYLYIIIFHRYINFIFMFMLFCLWLQVQYKYNILYNFNLSDQLISVEKLDSYLFNLEMDSHLARN